MRMKKKKKWIKGGKFIEKIASIKCDTTLDIFTISIEVMLLFFLIHV